MYEHVARDLREQSYYLPQDYTYRLILAAADAIDQLEALCKRQEAKLVELTEELASKPRWVPVAERLPEKNGPYLCCWKASADEKKHIARIMVWRADTGWMNAWDEPMSNYVTHWMSLPQPPDSEKESLA